MPFSYFEPYGNLAKKIIKRHSKIIGSNYYEGLTLAIGGVVAGIKSKRQGKGFWKGYNNYINQNWAQSYSISIAIAMVTFGISQAVQAISKAKLANSSCFKEGTQVLTEDGYKCIEDIEVGDKVLAYNEENGETDYKEVVRLFRNTTKQWTLVEVDGENGSETITCTPGHKFFLPENKNRRNLNEVHEHEGYELLSKQWVSAQDLKKDDKVLLENGKYVIIYTNLNKWR